MDWRAHSELLSAERKRQEAAAAQIADWESFTRFKEREESRLAALTVQLQQRQQELNEQARWLEDELRKVQETALQQQKCATDQAFAALDAETSAT